jgi:hypothetical protein
MLIRKKYIVISLVALVLLPALALVDLQRQQNLAEEFATKQMVQALSSESSLAVIGFPKSLLSSSFKKVDTNYTFTQWEVVFAFDKGGYSQVYVKPRIFFLIPVLNFKDDFEIDYINYEKS